MAFNNLQEEELKNRIGDAFFAKFDCDTRIGKIDFTVTAKRPKVVNASQSDTQIVSLLWAEAKRGVISDIYKPLVQLILTIGKARTFDSYFPPPFLAAFDAEKIAFLPYKEILPFFSLNDFNWNVAPSDDTTREFGMLYDAVKTTIERSAYIFRYDSHEKELREFIRVHLSENSELIQINKNNFVSIYQRWLAQVQPSIDVDWDTLKKRGIIDGDFFLADLLSSENQTIKDALFVLLKDNRYVLDRKIDASGLFVSAEVHFKDQQKAHAQFWSIYQRPPKEEYWDYIINRRDLLVPQDVRERKGSFFTPKIWVDLSQKYLADVLGENWQDEYYVWDCAAGTGNLLNGLTNKYRIWASTLDQQDVDVMKDRIKNGANLLESHVFQFDFLNDEFTKLPQPLQDIINDEEKRKKLVIYINPPYAEAGNGRTPSGTGKNRIGISKSHLIYEKFSARIGKAAQELFALFLIRIIKEFKVGYIAHFSTPKLITAPNFSIFRSCFNKTLETCFLVPANSFDNVVGNFPIGFFIWNCLKSETNQDFVIAHVYNSSDKINLGTKKLRITSPNDIIGSWIKTFPNAKLSIGAINTGRNDFQNNQLVRIATQFRFDRAHTKTIDRYNLHLFAIYFAVRHSIPHTWLNHNDLFLTPKESWQKDSVFHNNCLIHTLFHQKNFISSADGINHWIPFTEAEVNAKDEFESHFMTDFIAGLYARRAKFTQSDPLMYREAINEGVECLLDLPDRACPVPTKTPDPLVASMPSAKTAVKINVEATPPQDSSKTSLFSEESKTSFIPTKPLQFSPEATAVFDAGRELWRYYHAQPNANPNASYYDIRAHFQGRNDKGKMNPKSDDKEYMRLLGNLKEAMEALRLQIVPKVYEYGFLIE